MGELHWNYYKARNTAACVAPKIAVSAVSDICSPSGDCPSNTTEQKQARTWNMQRIANEYFHYFETN